MAQSSSGAPLDFASGLLAATTLAFPGATVSAADPAFDGPSVTKEQRIASANAYAKANGKTYVWIPLSMSGYNLALCPPSAGVQYVAEGATAGAIGTSATLSTAAYARGTSGNVANDNAVAVNAAIAAAPGLGATIVNVIAAHLPYTTANVTFNTTLRMTAEGHRPDIYDVQAYGAFGDGITDDAASINTCIAHAAANSGTVFFPKAVYFISTFTTLPDGGNVILSVAGTITTSVTLLGAPSATIRLASTLAGPREMLRVNTTPTTQLGGGVVKIIVDGLTFDLNSLQTGSGVRCLNTKDVIVRNCRFTNIGNNGANAGAYGLKFEGNNTSPVNPFVWAATAPTLFGQENKALFNTFDGFTGGTPGQNYGTGILVYEQDGCAVVGNTISSGIGVSCFGPNRRVIVQGNEIYDCGDVGIYFSLDAAGYGDNQRSREHVIADNVVRNCAGDSGIKCNGSRMTVRGNTCSYNANSGIKADHSSELTIVGNLCMGNTNRAIMLAKASLANEGSHDGAVIANNLCIDDAADGIFVQGGGDTGATPAKNVIITGNRVARNGQRGIRCDDCDSRLRIEANVCTENGAAGGVAAGIFLRASNLNWGGAMIALNRCAGLVTGVAATAKQPCGIQFDAASGKTLSVCYSLFNDCSDSPDVTASSGIAVCTQANRTGGGTVSGQYMRGTMYRNTTYGTTQAAVGVALQTTDIVLKEDESGLNVEFGPSGGGSSVGRRETCLAQNAGQSTTSTSDVSIYFFSLPAAMLLNAAHAIRVVMRGIAQTQAAVPNVKFGATVIATATVTAGNVFEIDAIVTRIDGTNQRAIATVDNGTAIAQNSRTTPTETLASAIGVDFRGSVTAGGTLLVDYMMVEYLSS